MSAMGTLFMRRPFFVRVWEVTEENIHELAKSCDGHVFQGNGRLFIQVPVDRPKNVKQTEAEVGMFILLASPHGRRVFKVYTKEALDAAFFEVENDIPGLEMMQAPVSPRRTSTRRPTPNDIKGALPKRIPDTNMSATFSGIAV